MVKDLVCGMEVDEQKAIKLEEYGKTYFFCSEYCKNKFIENEKKFDQPADLDPNRQNTIYTCPMHPEIKQNKPGNCPKCGMSLELRDIIDSENNNEERSLSIKFWLGLFLTVPVFILALGDMFPGFNFSALLSSSISRWAQLIISTPVIFWAGGMFFTRAWYSILNKSPNMFTLIAMGVGTAYGFSAIAVVFPGIFPESLKDKGAISLYFEAA